MKNKNWYICICFIQIIIIMLFSGCTEKNTADKSERCFSTIHFNGSNQHQRTLSATNGSEIFYVSGESVYQFGSSEPLLSSSDSIHVMTASENRLYILFDSDETEEKSLKAYDISTQYVSESDLKNIDNIAANGNQIFIMTDEENAFYFQEDTPENLLSLSEIICSGISYGKTDGYWDIFAGNIDGTDVYTEDAIYENGEYSAGEMITVTCYNQPRVLDNNNFGRSPMYLYDNKIYSIADIYCTEYSNDGSERVFELKKTNYNSFIDDCANQYLMDGVIYALLQQPNYSSSIEWAFGPFYNLRQNVTVNDCILAYDLAEKYVYTIYISENNLNRIIGFDGEKVYLFDVETYQIMSYSIETGEKTILFETEHLDELLFEWCGDVLFVYDNQNNVVDIYSAE